MLDLTAVFQSFPVIETARLRLRELVLTDAEAIFPIFSDPKVMAGHGTAVYKTVDRARSLINWYTAAFAEKQALRWGITLRGDDTVIGTCGYHEITAAHHRAELGYELHTAYWRRGIMFEAVQAVVRFGFEEMDFHRIEAIVDPDNLASANLLRKVGFHDEAYLRQRFYEESSGRFVDDLYLAYLKPDYDAAHPR